MYTFEQALTQVILALSMQLKERQGVTITGATCLYDLPGFDSLTVVSVLEQLETTTGIEMDPALIVPESFASPEALANALLQSTQYLQAALAGGRN